MYRQYQYPHVPKAHPVPTLQDRKEKIPVLYQEYIESRQRLDTFMNDLDCLDFSKSHEFQELKIAVDMSYQKFAWEMGQYHSHLSIENYKKEKLGSGGPS